MVGNYVLRRRGISKSTQSYNLNNLGSICVHDATYQVLSDPSVGSREKEVLKFLPYIGLAAVLVM